MKIIFFIMAITLMIQCEEVESFPVQKENFPNIIVIKSDGKVTPIFEKTKNVIDYGAIGDGISDDTKAIQKALDDGDGTVLLGKKHKISASLINRNKNTITYEGKGKAEILSDTNTFFKIYSVANIKISKLKVNPPFLDLGGTSSYDTVEVSNCDVISDIKNTTSSRNYAIKAKGDFHIQDVKLTNNRFENTTVFVASNRVSITTTTFTDNAVINFKSFVVSIKNSNFTYFKNNIIKGAMNGTGSVRVMFRTGLKKTYFINNRIENITSDVKTSVIYSGSGVLYFDSNILKNISGKGNTYIISDKGRSIEDWQIKNNIFDQSDVKGQSLNGLIKTGNNNTRIYDNIFIKLKAKAIQIGGYKEGISLRSISTIEHNQFIDTRYASIISFAFNVGIANIIDNRVIGLSNPRQLAAAKDTDCRFVQIGNTSPNYTIGTVNIKSNFLSASDASTSLLWINSKNGGGINKISIEDNIMDTGKSLIKYRNKEAHSFIQVSDFNKQSPGSR